VGNKAHMGEMRNAYTVFIRKPKGKGPLGGEMDVAGKCFMFHIVITEMEYLQT
jgi:hypothetical protein